jgi:recombinational DNA repair protein (RecF pathway)
MRHKYETRGIVLSRTHIGEATTFVTLITADLGLVYGRAQSLRSSGAKLAHALTTFAESSYVLVHGKEGWRVAGAVLEENWYTRLQDTSSRERAGRVSRLLLRLVAGEERDTELFPIMAGLFETLATTPPDVHESAEVLAVLRILTSLGLDTGNISNDTSLFAPTLLSMIQEERAHYIMRINNGITASGL